MVLAMGTVKSIAAARKAVREASAKAQEERARRERDNIEDLATFLVARDRLAAVDGWEAAKVAGIAAAAARRRDEHRGVAAVAICRIRGRGGHRRGHRETGQHRRKRGTRLPEGGQRASQR